MKVKYIQIYKTKERNENLTADRTADKRNIFSKGDSTNWIDKLYTITEIIDDTIPSYRIDNFPERYNEALLKKSKLTYDNNKNIMKK